MEQIMDLRIYPAPIEEKTVFENLMQLYLYDFSEFSGDDVDAQGCFQDKYLDRYWVEPVRWPFLVKADGHYAGFVMVRSQADDETGEDIFHIAEFFFMKKYRRRKVGQQVAANIFKRFPGKWRVEQTEENIPAQVFWRRVIAEVTGGNYREIRRPDWDGPVQEFGIEPSSSESPA
jgi:predicted acetyltransferase